jgi:Glycosyltransferase family 87
MAALTPVRVLQIGLVAIAFGLLGLVLYVYFDRGFIPGDAIVYLASGERLNAGHLLYALSPGDRIIALKPPYWTVPTLSPPFMAVLFRPLALLPPDLGAYVWWAATISSIAATLVILVRRIPILTSLAVLVLGVPIAYEIGVGNVNAFILAGSILVWFTATRGHGQIAGGLTAFLVMVKIWPLALVWWLVVQRRTDALRAGLLTGVVLAVISVLGAGIAAHFTYLQVIRDTASQGTSDLSVAGLARSVGVSPTVAGFLPWLVFIGGLGLAWLLRSRPGVSFACVIVAMVLGSSVVNINSFAMLIAILAPAAWPVAGRAVAAHPSEASLSAGGQPQVSAAP